MTSDLESGGMGGRLNFFEVLGGPVRLGMKEPGAGLVQSCPGGVQIVVYILLIVLDMQVCWFEAQERPCGL